MSDQGPTSFLPSEDAARDPDELLSALDDALISDPDALAIEAADDADVVLAEDEPPPLGRSWAFDFEGTGRFVGSFGAPLPTHGLSTLRTWIEKCLRTPRGTFPIHPPEYGVEGLLDVIGDPLLDGVEQGLEQRISAALLFHPSISEVADFTADLDEDGEALLLSFTVITGTGDELPFNNITLTGV